MSWIRKQIQDIIQKYEWQSVSAFQRSVLNGSNYYYYYFVAYELSCSGRAALHHKTSATQLLGCCLTAETFSGLVLASNTYHRRRDVVRHRAAKWRRWCRQCMRRNRVYLVLNLAERMTEQSTSYLIRHGLLTSKDKRSCAFRLQLDITGTSQDRSSRCYTDSKQVS